MTLFLLGMLAGASVMLVLVLGLFVYAAMRVAAEDERGWDG